MTPDHLSGSVIAHRNDRMGARIISILNAIRIARDYDLPWFCGWTTGGRTHEECRDPTFIFDEGFVAEHFFDQDVLSAIYDDLIDLSTVQTVGDKGRKSFLAKAAKGRSYLSGNAMGIITLPWEDEAEVARALPLCLDAFRYAPPVAGMIAEIDALFADKTLTAFHIRRGDIIHDPITSNKLWPNKYIPREFYEIKLERVLEDPTAQVLIFSDTPEEVTRLKQTSDRVMGVTDLFGTRDLTTGARDYLELFAMSRCKQIFGPPSSAYSQTAMTIGGCQLQDVQTSLTASDQSRAMDLMTERLEAKSDLFLNMGDVGQCLHFLIEHQQDKGNPNRAKRIIRDYMEDGLDKSFAYQLLCELSVGTGELAYCERVRELAYQRPVYVDESMALVNGYSALHQLETGDWATARQRLQSAIWFRPLEPIVHGALNLALSAEAITPKSFYPFDPNLSRQKKSVFPAGRKALADLNEIVPAGLSADDRLDFMPWDIVVRDWRMVMGKRLNRGFSNKSKIIKSHEMMERAFQKLAGSSALTSALGVLKRAMGDMDAALEAQREAVDDDPENALYRKRISDVLFETGHGKTALLQLEKAADASDAHPCYLAELAQHCWRNKRREDARDIHARLSRTDHDFVEIHLMTSEMLRRNDETLDLALDEIDKAMEMAHGAQRLMAAKARLLIQLDREDEAFALYQDIADWGLGTHHTFVEIYRQFSKRGKTDWARDLTDRSSYDFAMIRDMAEA